MSYQESFIDTIETNITKQPSKAQAIIQNPLKKKIFVNGILLTFNPYFSEKGVVMIKINGNIILPKKNAGAYKRLESLPINLKNEELPQQSKIEIFAWNGTDDDYVLLGYNVQISEDPNATISPDTSLTQQIRNSNISDSEELFPFKVYRDEAPTALIDMKGYKKLILSMSASTIEPIDDLSFPACNESVDITYGYGSCVFSPYATYNPTTESCQSIDDIDTNDENEKSLQMTFGGSSTQVIHVNSGTTGDGSGGGYYTGASFTTTITKTPLYTVRESNDPTFATYDELLTSVSSVPLPLATTKRYVRIIQDISITFSMAYVTGSHQNGSYSACSGLGGFWTNPYSVTPFTVTNIYDENTVGGTASVSFEILGSGNQWIELISSSEFGTITYGETVIKQIGDVVSRSGVDKVGFVLPSTQTNFRAKLTVTGGIETGVSIIKVS